MAPRPISRLEKFAQATGLWLFASLISIPLWNLALLLLECYRAGELRAALLELFLQPIGTFFAMAFMFGIFAEDGIGAIAAHYWPAELIATAFTVLFLRAAWRRG